MTGEPGLHSRDALTGHLAALVPGLPQDIYQLASEGLHTIGWRPAADHSSTEELLTEHSFTEDEDGDGWNEPLSHSYSCSCSKVQYAQWIQSDPVMTGLTEFREEGRFDAMALHHAHLAQVLLDAGGGIAASR